MTNFDDIVTKREKDKIRAKEWRKNNPNKIKAYLKRNKARIRTWRKSYYSKHEEELKAYASARRKRTNYAEDKSPERKAMMNIRSRTRHKYPLKGQKCQECGFKADHRHHTTSPPEVDKFIFMCLKCHNELHEELNDENDTIKGGQE